MPRSSSRNDRLPVAFIAKRIAFGQRTGVTFVDLDFGNGTGTNVSSWWSLSVSLITRN